MDKWEWRYTPSILNLGTRWRWAVRFTPPGEEPPVAIEQEAGGPQDLSRHYRKKKTLISAENGTSSVRLSMP